VKDNLRKLGYYGIAIVFGGFLVWALPGLPWAIPWVAVGLPVGVLLGFLTPARRRQRKRGDMTLTLTTLGGLLLAALARALIHDQQVLMGTGAAGLAAAVGWDLVYASRLVLREHQEGPAGSPAPRTR